MPLIWVLVSHDGSQTTSSTDHLAVAWSAIGTITYDLIVVSKVRDCRTVRSTPPWRASENLPNIQFDYYARHTQELAAFVIAHLRGELPVARDVESIGTGAAHRSSLTSTRGAPLDPRELMISTNFKPSSASTGTKNASGRCDAIATNTALKSSGSRTECDTSVMCNEESTASTDCHILRTRIHCVPQDLYCRNTGTASFNYDNSFTLIS